MLFPLMDMFFILLLFFLVAAGFPREDRGEKGRVDHIPQRDLGEVQILIQVVDSTEMLWFDVATFWEDGWDREFPSCCREDITLRGVKQRLARYYRTIGKCAGSKVYTALRCPDSLEYRHLFALQEHLDVAADSVMPKVDLIHTVLRGSAADITDNSVDPSAGDTITIRWQ